MQYKVMIILLIVIIAVSIYQTPVFAHRDGCHRWHSCPSDTGSYTCGDTGYCSECPDNNYCKAGQPISFSSYSSNSDTSNSTTRISTTSHPTATQSTPASTAPVAPTPVPTTHIPSTTPSKIPSWVKSIFSHYAQGNISEDELISAIKFLVQQGIIKLS